MEGRVYRVYVTKYALTRGVIMAMDVVTTSEPHLIATQHTVRAVGDRKQKFYRGQWYTDLETARVQAHKRRSKSLEKRRKNLEKLESITDFEIVESDTTKAANG